MTYQMWFGTRGFEQWVRLPNADMDSPYVGRYNRSNYFNGGAGISASAATHREYAMDWVGRVDEMEKISDILAGHYDTDSNDGLLYFVEPSTMLRNVLPRFWAAPYLCGLDAPSLTKTARPTLSATPTNTFGLPSRTATFTVGTDPLASLYIPIPPGFSIQFAFYGPSAQTSRIRVTPVGGSAADHDILANTAYGTGFTTISGVSGVDISLTPSAGTTVITAGIAQVISTGSSIAAPTQFISGKGHSGCKVDAQPSHVLNMAAVGFDWVTYSAHLVEVGAWL